MTMFEGFRLEHVDVGDVTLRVRTGGSGPPLLLLHGHPQTHVMWHRVAPVLAERFTLVLPDLRGYGESSKPRAHDPGPRAVLEASHGPGPCRTDGAAGARLVRGGRS